MSSCCLSIDNAETNNFDADILHHSTAITVRIMPIKPLKTTKTRHKLNAFEDY